MVGTETQRVPARAEVPAEYTWDLTTVYATDAAWGEVVAWIEAQLPQIAALQGTLGQGASSLVRALRLRDEIEMRADQITVYALQRRDSDSADPAGQALWSRAASLGANSSRAGFGFWEARTLRSVATSSLTSSGESFVHLPP
jgi:oligoendopeptidase F